MKHFEIWYKLFEVDIIAITGSVDIVAITGSVDIIAITGSELQLVSISRAAAYWLFV